MDPRARVPQLLLPGERVSNDRGETPYCGTHASIARALFERERLALEDAIHKVEAEGGDLQTHSNDRED
jgi:hypothetical protein